MQLLRIYPLHDSWRILILCIYFMSQSIFLVSMNNFIFNMPFSWKWKSNRSLQSKLKSVNKHIDIHQKNNSRARWCMKLHRRGVWPKIKQVLNKSKSNNRKKSKQWNISPTVVVQPSTWEVEASDTRSETKNYKMKQKSKTGGWRQKD